MAAIGMWRSEIYRTYWVLFSWVAFSAIAMGMLLAIRRSAAYGTAYAVTCLLLVLLESGVMIELFWQLSRNFRNFRGAGCVVLGILAGFGVLASAAIRLAWIPEDWDSLWQMALLCARHADAGMAIVLIGSCLVLRIPGVPIQPNAQRASCIMAGHTLWGWTVATVTITKGGRWMFWQSLLPVLGACFTGGLLALLMTREPDGAPATRRTTSEVSGYLLDRYEGRAQELRSGVWLVLKTWLKQ